MPQLSPIPDSPESPSPEYSPTLPEYSPTSPFSDDFDMAERDIDEAIKNFDTDDLEEGEIEEEETMNGKKISMAQLNSLTLEDLAYPRLVHLVHSCMQTPGGDEVN